MNPITNAFNFPEEILSKYDIIQEMGRGAFSIVYKIKSKADNTIYCLKKINIKKTPDRKNEINIL
jgi:serine/threonine protein kinase